MLWNLFESCGIELQSKDHLFLLIAASTAFIVVFIFAVSILLILLFVLVVE